MNRQEMMQFLQYMAKTSGRYGRILKSINNLSKEDAEMFWNTLEEMCFRDPSDFIEYIEG